MSSEQSIASARASVMIYDDVNKKWIPSGSSSGLSKVHVFQHQVNNTFRVVGRKLQNQEVVINCVILKSLKYNQATSTFHQWRDNKQVYGLNFSSKEDADSFARAMLYAVEVLASAPRPAVQQFPSPPVYPQTNGQYEEDMGYRPIIPMQQQQQTPTPALNQNNIVYSEHNLNHSLNNNHQPPLSHHQQDMPQVSYHHQNNNNSKYFNNNYSSSNHSNGLDHYTGHYHVAKSPAEEINYNGGYTAPPSSNCWNMIPQLKFHKENTANLCQ
ncbi:hypothetical protein M8J77_000937 [Diaphorina citri]|nr:hypothetical protein M8J77_000937 [Diaphorina citri]